MPSTIGSFNAYACTRAGVTSLLFHTVDGDSINAYAPHTLCTKLARISLAGIIGTTSAPLMYFNNSQPLNNANVYKGVQQVGSKLPRLGATKAFNVANAAAVAGDANGPQLPVGGFSDVEASLFPASLGGGNVSAKGTYHMPILAKYLAWLLAPIYIVHYKLHKALLLLMQALTLHLRLILPAHNKPRLLIMTIQVYIKKIGHC